MNYSWEEWRDLKIIMKDLAKEAIDEQIDKIPQSGLSQEEKIKLILPVLAHQIDQVAARGNYQKPKNYHKVEVSVVKKVKKIVSEVQGAIIRKRFGEKLSDAETKQMASKLMNTLESLTEEEIILLKEKTKLFLAKLINNYAPPQIKNSPEVMKLINSSINLVLALSDEKVLKNVINLMVKSGKLALQNPQAFKGKSPFVIAQEAGLEGDVKDLITGLTNHFNKLAGEGEQNNNLLTNQETIIQNLSSQLANYQPTSGGDNDFCNILSDNLLTKGLTNSFDNNSGNKELTEENILNDFKEVFTTTQSKEK
ncbi:15104_t:CDS:2 [Entrophospora sp. SA101]|nr:15104_t:CDS:2 [Entrophospora sp. SA101]